MHEPLAHRASSTKKGGSSVASAGKGHRSRRDLASPKSHMTSRRPSLRERRAALQGLLGAGRGHAFHPLCSLGRTLFL